VKIGERYENTHAKVTKRIRKKEIERVMRLFGNTG